MKSGNPFPLLYVPQRMGNTLEQHRAAIGGNAARQLSRGRAPSTGSFKPSTGLFKPLTTTEEKRKKPENKAKATTSLATDAILLGFMFFTLLTMACPLLTRVLGYVLCDHGSPQMAGSVNSEVMVLGPCSDFGMQEPHQGCWGQRMTEKGTSSYFFANFKTRMARTTMIQMHPGDLEPDPGLQVSSQIQILQIRMLTGLD